MIWAILASLGVPLWLCLAGIGVLIGHNRALQRRPGDVAVRSRRPGKSRWQRGHGVWVHDVFAFRGSPAGWSEALIGVREVVPIAPTEDDTHKLRHLGNSPSMVRLIDDNGAHVDFATGPEEAIDLLGPFALTAASTPPASSSEV
jgi:hypothetical protein